MPTPVANASADEEFLRPDVAQGRDAEGEEESEDGYIGLHRNEFSGIRSLFLSYDNYDDGIEHLFIVSAGRPGAGRFMYFRFNDPGSRDSIYYIRCRHFFFLVNGRRMAARGVFVNNGDGGVEGVTAVFDRNYLSLLAGARTVRFQGCLDPDFEYEFGADQLPRMKDWARRAIRFR